VIVLAATPGSTGEGERSDVTEERNNPDVTDDDHTRPRPLDGMEAARRAADDVVELTGHQPGHVVSVAKQDDSWHIGLEVVELQRIPESADVLAVYEVTLDVHGELVTCRRGRRYLRGSTEESR
jgi:hypothetical protein